MKNDHLPLIQALKGRSKPKADVPAHEFEAPRVFEIQHHEIPGLPSRRVGEGISVKLHGKVHSQHADGRMMMHVDSVKPDSEEMTEKGNPDSAKEASEIKVRTQESHA